jgi:hypothetical protein
MRLAFPLLVSLCCSCGIAARVGAGVTGTTTTVAPEIAPTVGLVMGDREFNIVSGISGAFGFTTKAVPVGRATWVEEGTYTFKESPWGVRVGLGVGPNFDGARGVGWLVFARAGPTFMISAKDSGDLLTQLGLDLTIGLTGFPKADLFWGVTFDISWLLRVFDRFPMGS